MKRKINYQKPDSNSLDGAKADRYTADEISFFSQHSTNTIVGSSFSQHGIFSWHKGEGVIWFRVFGYGLHVKDTRKRFLLFSERNGYKKRLQIGNYSIRILKPNGI